MKSCIVVPAVLELPQSLADDRGVITVSSYDMIDGRVTCERRDDPHFVHLRLSLESFYFAGTTPAVR